LSAVPDCPAMLSGGTDEAKNKDRCESVWANRELISQMDAFERELLCDALEHPELEREAEPVEWRARGRCPARRQRPGGGSIPLRLSW
jgi:hypothetical protein